MPRLAHAEKGGVGDGLGICRDSIVFVCGEIYMLRLQTAEDGLDFLKRVVGGTVFDKDLVSVRISC